ncbi:MAG: retroviral-like aspartic protease family protein [Planctomycetes bacterium]|nr:retroviral-like aspartic protease family protein [Planctomycetota bacterium]MBU4398415.1 retroviral-like aspartic protease family protein [Planctomycetota bacterium]MCG2683853.1 retroviral-like aspartic protease family protein [Planctomycetales bacterium]
METETMGRVLTEAVFENREDLWAAEKSLISPDQVRRVKVSDALVDTGATYLSMPARLIRQLGLRKFDTRRVKSVSGIVEANLYGSVRMTIQDRTCHMDVMEVSDDVPVLIGQLALEDLDFVVDPQSRRLIGNPAHGGEHMYELYLWLSGN